MHGNFLFRRRTSLGETNTMPFYSDGITLVLVDIFILYKYWFLLRISENKVSLPYHELYIVLLGHLSHSVDLFLSVFVHHRTFEHFQLLLLNG